MGSGSSWPGTTVTLLVALAIALVAATSGHEMGSGSTPGAASAWRDAVDGLLEQPPRGVADRASGRWASEADPRAQDAQLHRDRQEQALRELQAREAARRKNVSLPLAVTPLSVVPVRAGAEFWEHAQEGRWEPATFKALYQEVTADVAYLGVGEWCGVTGLMAAQRARRAVLVEPDPLALEELQTNVNIYNAESRGSAPRIKIDNRCVSTPENRGAMTMTGNGSSTSSLLWFPWLEGAPTFEANCATLPDVYNHHGMTGKVFIKMDIEGAEASVVPTLLSWIESLETKPSFFISFHGRADAQQKREIAKVFNLYKYYAVIEGRTGSDNDKCKMGVPLSENLDGTAFSAENVCDECDVLLTTSRARSDTLCAKNRAQIVARSAKRHMSQKPTQKGHPTQSQTPTDAHLDRRMRSQTHHDKFHTQASHGGGSISLGGLNTELHALEETVSDLNLTVDELSREVAQLQVQHDWANVASGYMTCELGMTWDQILQAMEQQRSSDTLEPHIVTGGLGRKMIPGKFEVWVCIRPDRCATSPDDFMCYVYDEQEHVFVPWEANSELKLVKGGPFWSLRESTAGIALAEVRKLRQEVKELKTSMVSGGGGPFTGSHVRKFTSEQNVSSSLWRETAALFFVPDQKSEFDSHCFNTIDFSPLLAADKGSSTCFGSLRGPCQIRGLRFTAMQTNYVGHVQNELMVSAGSPDFCLGNRFRVSALQHVSDRFQITNFGGSPLVAEPLPPHHFSLVFAGAGYQPVAVPLSHGRGVLFVNFHAGQNYQYWGTQRGMYLWGDVPASNLTRLVSNICFKEDAWYSPNHTKCWDDDSDDNFHYVSAGPLVKEYSFGPRGVSSRYSFGRTQVATAHSGQHVWFAGGVEVTGDGPQGNVIIFNKAGPGSASHSAGATLPSLRPLADVDILNVDTGNWAQGNLSSARFGVSGVGVDRFIFFAGGAQLGSPDASTVVDQLTWEVNVSNCQQCMKRSESPEDPCSYQGYSYQGHDCNEMICYYRGCKAVPIEKTAINSDIVEVFDVHDVGDSITRSQQQLTLSQARRFAASGVIPALNLVLFAGGVTANEPSLPDGGWLPTQTSSSVDIYSVAFDGSISSSTASITAGKMVAGSAGNLVVLVRHHENAVFDSAGHVYDGSSWTSTTHPGQCGVQDSTASTQRFLVFLSACEPEALLFDLSARSWHRQALTHSPDPSRVVAALGDKLLFAGRVKEGDEECPKGGPTHLKASYCSSWYIPECCRWSAPAPPSGSSGLCGWDGLGSWRSAGCGGSAGLYSLPPGFVTASVEITSSANPAQTVSRTVALPAHLPEVDVTLSLPHHANTNHVASDRWDVSCDALVNGQSMHSRLAIGQDDTICITPHDDNDDEFVVYGGQLV